MRILLIADLHIGSIKDTQYMYDVIIDIFDREILFNKCDMIIFLGDYFDKIFKTNEEYTSLAINIMSYLVILCMKTNTKIRLIYGTESHEMNQYILFNHYLNIPDIDFKVIYTVTSENINGKNILYIPEEFVEDKRKHYENFFNKRYDYILGHGIINEGFPMINMIQKPKSNEKQVPHFRSNELLSICKVCVFGHYHIHNDYYQGSLFRTRFGEEEPKGYGIINNDRLYFIENKSAYIFDTITFETNSDVYTNIELLTSKIHEIKRKYEYMFSDRMVGKIRLEFHLPLNIDIIFKETIRSLLFNEKYISLLIKEESELMEEMKDSIDEEYDYVLDKDLPLEDKLHRHIHENHEIELTLDRLKRYITEPLKI